MKQDGTAKAPHLAEIDAFYAEKLSQANEDASISKVMSPDYDASEVPAALLGSSFGCGNPVAFSEVEPGDTVLDLGCGVGLDLIIAAEKTGPAGKVIGIDMNDDMVNRARTNATKNGFANIEVLTGAIEALPFPDRSVDWVVSNCVINLSLDKPAVFSEINRVLKPGGKMLVSDIVADDLPDWTQIHSDLYAACISAAVPEVVYVRLASNGGLSALRIVDTLVYDDGALRYLIKEELPVAIDKLSKRFNLSTEAMLDKAVSDLAGKVKAIKLYGERAN